MEKKCVRCDILLDVPCAHPGCAGHHNESWGDVCVYCATNERENMDYLRKFFELLYIQFAQFLAVCSASNLAKAMCISSLVQGTAPAKTWVFSRLPRAYGHYLQPSTNC